MRWTAIHLETSAPKPALANNFATFTTSVFQLSFFLLSSNNFNVAQTFFANSTQVRSRCTQCSKGSDKEHFPKRIGAYVITCNVPINFDLKLLPKDLIIRIIPCNVVASPSQLVPQGLRQIMGFWRFLSWQKHQQTMVSTWCFYVAGNIGEKQAKHHISSIIKCTLRYTVHEIAMAVKKALQAWISNDQRLPCRRRNHLHIFDNWHGKQ